MIILLEPYRVETDLSEVLERCKASDASRRNISSVILRPQRRPGDSREGKGLTKADDRDSWPFDGFDAIRLHDTQAHAV
jgi:hypothetical protein